MISSSTFIAVALVSLAMVCSPGPNMIYLISRSITQGRKAGVISLFGVVAGFVFYVLATMLGLSVLFKTVPLLYQVVKWAGALYLLWLAWNAVKPGGQSIFTSQAVSIDSPRKMFLMGFITNAFNPKRG
ncbi:LysE family translocator [Paenibacillaceae bacterium]|nr:LysE family translocator [Paenibacillaceae bacterium]